MKEIKLRSAAYKKYVKLRLAFIIALGGECQYVYESGKICGWKGEGDLSVLQVHHVGGRSYGDHNFAIREIFKWGKTRKLPKRAILYCPNHHVIVDKKERKERKHGKNKRVSA